MKRVLPLIWCASILATAACSGGGGVSAMPAVAQVANVAGPKVAATQTPLAATPAPIATQPIVIAYEPIVDSNAAYGNANPAPQGGALGGTTVGPAYARDPFHIDWDRFCLAHPTNCANGDPKYVSNDASMIANTLPSSPYGAGVTYLCNGASSTHGNDNCGSDVGVYYATTSDPMVRISCAVDCGVGPSGSGSLNGASIYIPAGALPQQGEDAHMSVKQPSGTICQVAFGAARTPPIYASAITVQYGACGPAQFSTEGSSLLISGGYAGNGEMSRGFVRPEDIVGSNGDGSDAADPYSYYHAMYGAFSNNAPGTVWPAIYGDGRCSAGNAINGSSPREGMYLYLDSAGFRIVQAWNPPTYLRWLKRALGSVHRHGMIDMDSTNCTKDASKVYVNTLTWGSQSYVLGGGTSPIDAFLANTIRPHDAAYAPSGAENAISVNAPGASYSFDVLWYRDVPGLSTANFHWLGGGCGQIAVQGASSNGC